MQSCRSNFEVENTAINYCELLKNIGNEDNLDSPHAEDSSILSILTNQFVSEACNIPKRLYCPFCLFDFGFDFLLKAHINNLHTEEIKNFSKTKLDSFTFDPCCYCHAKFYVRGLLPKHIIRKHQECIIGLISQTNSNGDISCKFCSYKISLKQLKLLFIHLENKHLEVFVETLSSYNLNISSVAPLETEQTIRDLNLSREICKLNIAENSEHDIENLKPILKRGSLLRNSSEFNEFDQNWVPKIRRKLRFDLPDLSISSENSNKENMSDANGKRIFGIKFNRFKKSEKPKLIVTPNKIEPEPEKRAALGDITSSTVGFEVNVSPSEDGFDNLEIMPFKCGVCLKQFYDNAELLYHVKRTHKKINFQAKYRCGMCKAKFFRNSYLVRHNKAHNKPKCLTAFEYKPL